MDAVVDALVEEVAGPGEAEAVEGGWVTGGGGAEGGLGVAGEEANFEGAFDVAGVLQGDVFGGGGVEGEELGDFFFEGERGEMEAECGVAGWEGIEAVGEGFEVEAGAADDDGEATAGGDVVQDGEGEGAEVLGVAGRGGGEVAEEVMGDEAEFGGGGFGGDEVEALVELEGVGVDDFAIELEGEVEGRSGFAGGGGADDIEGLRRWGVRRHLRRGGIKKSPSHGGRDGLLEINE
jgi:hypothetical protein